MSLEFIPSGDPVVYDGVILVPDDNVSSSPLINGPAFVLINVWVQLYATPSTENNQILFIGEAPPSNNSRCEVQVNTAGKFQVIVRVPDLSAAVSVLSTANVPVETAGALAYPRHMLTAKIDCAADAILLYIDGVLDSTHTVLGLGAAFSATNSGASSYGFQEIGPAQGWNGKLSDLRVYEEYTNRPDINDLVKTLFYMNGHDTVVGNARRELTLMHHMDRRNGGVAAVLADVPDESPAALAPPTAISETPVFRDYQQAFRRFVN